MKLWVDFNDEAGGQIEADLDYALFFNMDDLTPGSQADLFDGAGYECKARVTDYDSSNRVVRLRILPGTWQAHIGQENVWAAPEWSAASTGRVVGVA